MKTFATPLRPAPKARRKPVRGLGTGTPRRTARAQIHQVLHGPRLQPKLTVGPPGDAYEREADRVADRVMRMPEPDGSLQRMCSECEEELRRKRGSGPVGVPDVGGDLEARIRALRGGGCPLPDSTRAFFEPRFGQDFGAVRLHTGPRAAELARSVDARAFTVDQDVVWGAGEPAPETPAARKLLAHELTHVVQQTGGGRVPENVRACPRIQAKPTVGPPAFEGEAGRTSGRDLRMPGLAERLQCTCRECGEELRRKRSRGDHVILRAPTASPSRRGGSLQTRIQREITERSIRNGDFFSINCGWVDAGHANPGGARALIAQVREASQRIGRREEQLEQTLAAEPVPTLTVSSCSVTYDQGEEAQSHDESPVMESVMHPSGAMDIVLGGFGVDSASSAKFGSNLDLIAQSYRGWQVIQGRPMGIQVLGFTDCVGGAERNERLRMERAVTISLGLARNGIQVDLDLAAHRRDEYLASNATRAGRRKNRGVLIRFVPRAAPETFTTKTAESRVPVVGIQMSAVTPTATLNRSLTEAEVLSVALSIFSAQSVAFEHLQQWRDVIPFAPPSSSFAEEDLPSNLIGFYRAARGFSFPEVRTICDAWPETRSIAHLAGYSFRRNPSFAPPSLPPGGTWPTEFQSISPAPFDSDAFRILNLRLSTPLLTLDCSVDPRTNTLRCP